MFALRRVSAIRAPMRTMRHYSTENNGPQPSGSPDSFGQREKASEDWYIKQHEKDQLKKLHDEISKREKEIGDLKDKASKLSQ